MHGLELCILSVTAAIFFEVLYTRFRDVRYEKNQNRHLYISEQHLRMAQTNFENGQAEQRLAVSRAFRDGVQRGITVAEAKAATAKKAAEDKAAFEAAATEESYKASVAQAESRLVAVGGTELKCNG